MARPGGRSDQLSSPRLRVFAASVCIAALVVGTAICGSELANTSQAQVPKHTASSPRRALGPAAATAAFGLDLMRAQRPGNLVLSPDSVAAALAMTGTGATGRTAAQIARALHLGKPTALSAMGDLQRAIAARQASIGQGHPKAPTLNMANGLFLQRGFPIKPTFLSGLQRHFGTTPENVDFVGDPSGSLEKVNGWASDHTMGLIPQILASLPRETRFVLANAVYLKADWRHPFELKDTAPGPFYNQAGSVSAQFMHQTTRLSYGQGRSYKAVELPYRASTLSLLVVLPVGKRLGSLQHRLGARGLNRIVRNLSPTTVRLSLPRFHLNTQTELNETLKKLGMTTAFSESADFSRITTAVPLKIALVEHAADFKVDESGTVAAAATTVVGVARSRPRAVTFNANRPFLFFLRDRRTGAVLFAGRLADPASAGA